MGLFPSPSPSSALSSQNQGKKSNIQGGAAAASSSKALTRETDCYCVLADKPSAKKSLFQSNEDPSEDTTERLYNADQLSSLLFEDSPTHADGNATLRLISHWSAHGNAARRPISEWLADSNATLRIQQAKTFSITPSPPLLNRPLLHLRRHCWRRVQCFAELSAPHAGDVQQAKISPDKAPPPFPWWSSWADEGDSAQESENMLMNKVPEHRPKTAPKRPERQPGSQQELQQQQRIGAAEQPTSRYPGWC
eukprot:9143331-Pyramimonas_sp.AAC.1